jgi:RHS repeat-associated protein
VTYYTWNYRNRLTEVKQEDSQGHVLNDETFTYDVNNNRIGVSLNGTQQLYTVYDGSNPYMDFNGSGQLTERYLTNPNGLSQFYGQVSASGVTQWFLTDNLNSIRQVVSASGASLDAITYDPFGNILNQTNAANAPRFLFTGGVVDSLTGTYEDGAREEDPVDGRWLNQDPKGFAAGDTNLYRYVFNTPTIATDPTGLMGSVCQIGPNPPPEPPGYPTPPTRSPKPVGPPTPPNPFPGEPYLPVPTFPRKKAESPERTPIQLPPFETDPKEWEKIRRTALQAESPVYLLAWAGPYNWLWANISIEGLNSPDGPWGFLNQALTRTRPNYDPYGNYIPGPSWGWVPWLTISKPPPRPKE